MHRTLLEAKAVYPCDWMLKNHPVSIEMFGLLERDGALFLRQTGRAFKADGPA